MKHFSLLLALLAMPDFALSQTTVNAAPLSAQGQSKTPQTDTPDAHELFDHLFAPYEAAKSFRGTFDISIKGDAAQMYAHDLHLETRFRFNDNGDKEREATTLSVVGDVGGQDKRQTVQLVDDGQAENVLYIEQRAWQPTPRDAAPALYTVLQPVLAQVVKIVDEARGVRLVVAKGVDGGRPVYIVSIKKSDVLRVVVDAQTRALRSLELQNSISIRGSGQSFDDLAPDAQFQWAPPAGWNRVADGAIELPPFMRRSTSGATVTVLPKN